MSRPALRTLLAAFALAAAPTVHAQTTEQPGEGASFLCSDGSKMVLSFSDSGEGVTALVWLRGVNYRLAWQPPEPGPVHVAWSDGDHELTWSPGVRLMWMASDTHLMCGRGDHKH